MEFQTLGGGLRGQVQQVEETKVRKANANGRACLTGLTASPARPHRAECTLWYRRDPSRFIQKFTIYLL